MARANLVRAGLLDYVDLRLGEATAIVAELAGPFDFSYFSTAIGRAHPNSSGDWFRSSPPRF